MINYFKSKKTKVILVSTIWHEYDFIDGIPHQRQSKKDNAIKQIAEENNYDFVDISEIRNEELFFAYDEFPNNRDIGAHPNDLGMRFIFNKIIEKL